MFVESVKQARALLNRMFWRHVADNSTLCPSFLSPIFPFLNVHKQRVTFISTIDANHVLRPLSRIFYRLLLPSLGYLLLSYNFRRYDIVFIARERDKETNGRGVSLKRGLGELELPNLPLHPRWVQFYTFKCLLGGRDRLDAKGSFGGSLDWKVNVRIIVTVTRPCMD